MPKGQRDYSGLRLTRHALERFVERFWTGPAVDPDRPEVESALRAALERTRRLGRNPSTHAIAVLALVGERILVAVIQNDACLTVMTWPQFEPRLREFGRARLPRKRGRMLARLGLTHASGSTASPLGDVGVEAPGTTGNPYQDQARSQ